MERLPVEVLEIIFQKLPQSIEGVATLLSLRTVEKYVGNIAIGNPAWEGQLARWQHAEPTLLRGQHTAYEFYVRRAKNDRTASIKITALIDTTGNRLPQMQDITTDGLNILDRLIQLSKIDATDDEENYLATRYWAIKSIETVSRRHAITVWTKMAQGGYEDQAEAFEEGALAFGLFRGQTVGQTKQLLDEKLRLDPAVVRYLETSPPLPLQSIAGHVYDMLITKGIQSASGADFHRIDNHYVHLALSNPDRGTLPMTWVVLFTSFIRRLPKSLGLTAYPVGFPGTMLAGLSRGGESIYFDPYNGGKVLQRHELETMAVARGFGPEDDIYEAADPVSMCRRIAQNITTSMQVAQVEDGASSLYALATAQFFLVLPFVGTTLPRQNSHSVFAGWMIGMIQQSYPFDLGLFEELVLTHLPPSASVENMRRGCATLRVDDARPIERKDLGPERSEWRVGDIIRHRRYDYAGVIMGMDAKCEADENWIRSMRINSLENGTAQKFFNVAVEDGSTRYVAMENLVRVEEIEEARLGMIEKSDVDLGLRFRRLERGTRPPFFVPTPELVAIYGERN